MKTYILKLISGVNGAAKPRWFKPFKTFQTFKSLKLMPFNGFISQPFKNTEY